MDRRSLHILGIAFFLSFSTIKAQDSTIFEVNETDVEILYKHYVQDGDQSAVEGGKGSEKLKVYGPEFNFRKRFKENSLNFNFGVDLISSASIDKIDFIQSSASENDGRAYSNVSYLRQNENEELSWGGNLGLSIESDYLSIHGGGNLVYRPTATRKYTARVDYFYDDLRWGRLDDDFYEPVTVIYPVELRGTNWLPNYLRRSLNVQLGVSEYLSKRDVFGVNVLLIRQWGLLSTPHHRVYFSDQSLGVENLPEDRWKFSVAPRWNHKWSETLLTQTRFSFYMDDFGIQSIGIKNKMIIRLNEKWALMPSIRIYAQGESDFYALLGDHNTEENYYTSDFDLANFESVDIGAEIRYRPFQIALKKYFIDEIVLGYSYYSRSEGMKAHYISLSMHFHYRNKT